MATLTETAYLARKSVNLGAIILVLIIILRVLIMAGIGLKDKLFPPPPPAATVTFGKLPYPNAQNNIASPSSALSYNLETIDGTLPAIPSILKVYFMPRPGPGFGSFEKMTAQAAKIGFTDVPQKISGTAWRFTDKDNLLRTLDIDEISGNFRLTYNYLSDLSLFNEKNLGSQDAIVSDAQGFFDQLGILSSDLRAGTPTVILFHLDAGALVLTTTKSNTDAASVTLNRSPLGDTVDPKGQKFPVVSPDASQGLVSLLISGSSDPKKKVLEARYLYLPIDQENWATYPLVTPAVAFEKLKAGKAIYASLPSPLPTTISIRQIFLAYLDPYPSQSYLEPVLVFSDQKGFVAYVPAVSPEWTE